MKDLWRYESDEGIGPYELGRGLPDKDQLFYTMYVDHNWRDDRLTLAVDILAKHELRWVNANDYRSGCPSRRKLTAWFKGYEDQLRQEGFKISHYLVPDSAYINSFSRKQCAANLTGLNPIWRG